MTLLPIGRKYHKNKDRQLRSDGLYYLAFPTFGRRINRM